jgi:hypothetical protein
MVGEKELRPGREIGPLVFLQVSPAVARVKRARRASEFLDFRQFTLRRGHS